MDRFAARPEKPNNVGLLEWIKQLPPHMGWGPITVEKRRLMGLLPDESNANVAPATRPLPDPAPANVGQVGNRTQKAEQLETLTADIERPQLTQSAVCVPSIKIFGHTLDAIHRNKKDGCGRVWLLARYLDQQGEGRIQIKELRHEICTPAGRVRCLSKKRLQQIVRVGEGMFWHRSADGRYLYYHSEARVAAALGVFQIKGFAVEVPIVKLVQKIRLVRAVFYNAFHSGRGDGYNNPISRRVMQDRGMKERRTQRKYEAAEAMGVRSEFAVIGRYSKFELERSQYEDADTDQQSRVGGPVFVYIDYKGILGKNPDRGKRPAHQRHWHNIFLVRQIGNSYSGTLESPKRGRGWTNQRIRHLYQSMLSITGSADIDDSNQPAWAGRIYHEDEKQLERAVQRDKETKREQPLYCPHSGYRLNLERQRRVVLDNGVAPAIDHYESNYWQEAPPFLII